MSDDLAGIVRAAAWAVGTVGASLPVCRAGILLAHLTHAPSLKVQMAFTMTNLRNVEVLESFELITDWRAARWAEFFYSHDIGPDLYKRRRRAITHKNRWLH